MKSIEHLPLLGNSEEPDWKRYVADTMLAAVAALLVTGSIYMLQLYPRIPNISLLYLLVVLGLASTRGRYTAIITSIVAFFSFDFFLVPPLYTFTINKFDEWLALLIFLATAIITGQLASALRLRAEQASQRESETHALYDLVSATTSEEGLERQLSIVAHTIVNVFSSAGVCDCAILLPNAEGKLSLQANLSPTVEQMKLSPEEEATAALVMTRGQIVDVHGSPADSLAPGNPLVAKSGSSVGRRHYVRMIPLNIGQRVVGVVRLLMLQYPQTEQKQHPGSTSTPRAFVYKGKPKGAMELPLEVERERLNPHTAFFWTFLDQAASIIERARLHRESLQVEVLQRTDALRAALLSSISHDLRTPLSAIKAAASSLLQEDVQWDEETRHSFTLAIEREADRLNRLVGNLLDMSRIEGGALKPEKEWYPIDELIHDVLDRMRFLLQERDVRISLPENLPPVELDYLQMDQVLTNLIENALHYTPAGTPVEISVQVTGEEMTISIADYGPGIPPNDRERIFDKFYRVLGTQRKGKEGSGLGLAVCRGLVEAHGGHIWVENRNGGGAIFRFTLPLAKVEGQVHE
jgi:two-component system, OmpR family, sensor histidine kinase KdpD